MKTRPQNALPAAGKMRVVRSSVSDPEALPETTCSARVPRATCTESIDSEPPAPTVVLHRFESIEPDSKPSHSAAPADAHRLGPPRPASEAWPASRGVGPASRTPAST